MSAKQNLAPSELKKLQAAINRECDITLVVDNFFTGNNIQYNYTVLTFEDYEFITIWLKNSVVGNYEFGRLTFN